MKAFAMILIAGSLTAVFAAGITIEAQPDNRRIERKSPQQIAQERREERQKQQQINNENRRNANSMNTYQNPEPAYNDRAGRYDERYGRYNQPSQNRNYRLSDRQRFDEVNSQIAQATENLNRSRQDVQMYEADLKFFNNKKICYQRSRGPRDLDRCDQNFR